VCQVERETYWRFWMRMNDNMAAVLQPAVMLDYPQWRFTMRGTDAAVGVANGGGAGKRRLEG